MPHGVTSFQISWLTFKDQYGFRIGDWCGASKQSSSEASCRLCNKSFQCGNQGLQQILQHSRGKVHKKLSSDLLGGTQTTILKNPPSTSADPCILTSTISCISQKDRATAAELIWGMKVVKSHYTYESCNELKETLQAMFPDSIPENFTISARKVSYLISDALGPFFHKELLKDVIAANTPFTIEFDETTNKQVAKQLDVKIRFWSSVRDEVIVGHLQTFLIGHATGVIVADKIMLSMRDNGIPLARLLMLGCDGPNVNKTVWNKINETVLTVDRPGGLGLLDIGTCFLHIVHNAFGKGLSSFGSSVSDLIVDIYIWFKLSAARCQDYAAIQLNLAVANHKFLKHVECRWLTLLPAMERLLEQWPALSHYILDFLPKKQNSISENSRYKRIKHQVMRQEEVLVELQFLKSVAEIFVKFLELFQREQPLIHILWEKLLSLLKQLLGRFIRKDVLGNCKTIRSLALLDVSDLKNQLDDDTIELGEEARKVSKTLSIDKRRLLMLGIRKFYCTVNKYLQEKISKSISTILSICSCLQPQARIKEQTLEHIKRIARKLPIHTNIDDLGDEWRAYQCEEIPENWCADTVRIDHYWRNVCHIKSTTGELKYPTLQRVVKTILVISHGNAAVERGFSESGKSVTYSRTNLNEASINGILSIRNGLKGFNNKPHLVPISGELLSLGRSAHAHYVQRIVTEKKEKEERLKAQELREVEAEERAKVLQKLCKSNTDIQEETLKLEENEVSQKAEMEVGNSLLKEANKKLKEALKKKDFPSMSVAQVMLETAQAKIQGAKEKLETTRKKQRVIEKRKQTVLDDFVSCKKKK